MADVEGAAEVVEAVGELAVEGGGEVGGGEVVGAEVEVFVGDGVAGEGVAAGDGGDGGAAAGGEGGGFGVVAVGVGGEEFGVFGLPEAFGGGGEEVVGEGVVVEDALPGGFFGLGVGRAAWQRAAPCWPVALGSRWSSVVMVVSSVAPRVARRWRMCQRSSGSRWGPSGMVLWSSQLWRVGVWLVQLMWWRRAVRRRSGFLSLSVWWMRLWVRLLRVVRAVGRWGWGGSGW